MRKRESLAAVHTHTHTHYFLETLIQVLVLLLMPIKILETQIGETE